MLEKGLAIAVRGGMWASRGQIASEVKEEKEEEEE